MSFKYPMQMLLIYYLLSCTINLFFFAFTKGEVMIVIYLKSRTVLFQSQAHRRNIIDFVYSDSFIWNPGKKNWNCDWHSRNVYWLSSCLKIKALLICVWQASCPSTFITLLLMLLVSQVMNNPDFSIWSIFSILEALSDLEAIEFIHSE